MRLTEFAFSIIERFAPMSEKSAVELKNDSMAWYSNAEKENKLYLSIKNQNSEIENRINDPSIADDEKEKLLSQLQTVPRIGIQHKVVSVAEQWWFRTILAIAFIWIVPKIQNYLNPTKSESELEYDDEED